ncbi:MAG: hypothetical protein QGG42_10040 [Phycisphaerae bacterium]|jgi:hypothetical protein|nr:hypothetical protein [Phycisphaerae bacterium]
MKRVMAITAMLLLTFAISCQKADINGDTDVEDKSPNEARLASLRKRYLYWTEILYTPIKGKPIIGADGKIDHERLGLTRLWIDALLENDRPAEALELAMECKRVFDTHRNAQTKKIDDKYAPTLRACKAAVGLPKVMAKLVNDYKAELVRFSKVQNNSAFDPKPDSRPVDMAFKVMELAAADGGEADKIKRWTAAVSQELVTGYGEIIRRLKNRIPIYLNVEWSVAKCLAATGKHNDALKIYSNLIFKTDRLRDDRSERRFWRLQLEYCQVFVKGRSKNAKLMSMLANHIEKNLKKLDGGSFGGFKSQFSAIRERARSLSK